MQNSNVNKILAGRTTLYSIRIDSRKSVRNFKS
ncbi:hypothetical protein M8J77_008403 [Diaphorina citri]|nr:hypothetical protein M8J77_008403 [Diaphorina citri]